VSILLIERPRRRSALPFPSDITNLSAWYKADALGLNDGDAISSWTDSSGNAHHAVQATSANQPIYKAGVVNAKSAARFNGTSTFVKIAFVLTQPVTRFVVAKRASAGAFHSLVDGAATYCLLRYENSDALTAYAGSFLTWGTPTPTSGQWRIHQAIFNGASSSVRLRGGAAVTGDTNVLSPGGVTIGSYFAGDGLFFNGDIAEVIVYSRVLTNSESDRVGNYLASKYALTWAVAS
jgi:hypothetical protein